MVSAGGSAEAAEVDALEEQSVDNHLQSVTDKAGCVDISSYAVGTAARPVRKSISRDATTNSGGTAAPRVIAATAGARPTEARGDTALHRHVDGEQRAGEHRTVNPHMGCDGTAKVTRHEDRAEDRRLRHDIETQGNKLDNAD
jgi:hypothetical protein